MLPLIQQYYFSNEMVISGKEMTMQEAQSLMLLADQQLAAAAAAGGKGQQYPGGPPPADYARIGPPFPTTGQMPGKGGSSGGQAYPGGSSHMDPAMKGMMYTSGPPGSGPLPDHAVDLQYSKGNPYGPGPLPSDHHIPKGSLSYGPSSIDPSSGNRSSISMSAYGPQHGKNMQPQQHQYPTSSSHSMNSYQGYPDQSKGMPYSSAGDVILGRHPASQYAGPSSHQMSRGNAGYGGGTGGMDTSKSMYGSTGMSHGSKGDPTLYGGMPDRVKGPPTAPGYGGRGHDPDLNRSMGPQTSLYPTSMPDPRKGPSSSVYNESIPMHQSNIPGSGKMNPYDSQGQQPGGGPHGQQQYAKYNSYTSADSDKKAYECSRYQIIFASFLLIFFYLGKLPIRPNLYFIENQQLKLKNVCAIYAKIVYLNLLFIYL